MSKLTELQRAEIVSWLESLPWWDEVFAATVAGGILLRAAEAAKGLCGVERNQYETCYVPEIEPFIEQLDISLDEARKAGLIQ